MKIIQGLVAAMLAAQSLADTDTGRVYSGHGAYEAAMRVQQHPKLPPGTHIATGPINGGCGITLNIDGKEEVFVHHSYARAADEVEKWLEMRVEKVPKRKANRRERRIAQEMQRKKKAAN